MRQFKAIILDLDGTLLGPDRTISSQNIEAVRGCIDRGLHVIIATARPQDSVRYLLPDWLYNNAWKICHNGAMLIDSSDRTRFRMTISSDQFLAVRDQVLATDRRRPFSWYDQGRWYANHVLDDRTRSIYGVSVQYPPPAVLDPFVNAPMESEKILLPDLADYEGFYESFGEKLTVIRTKDGLLTMVMATAVGKEKASAALLDELGLSSGQVLVFGDDTNDLALFQRFPYCVAMGNSMPELKALAWRVTGLHSHPDSIANVLRETVLAVS